MGDVTGGGCGRPIGSGSAAVRWDLKGRPERGPRWPGGAHGQHQQPPRESGVRGARRCGRPGLLAVRRGGGRSRPGRRGRPVRGWPAVPYAPPGGGVAVGLRGRPRRPLGQGGRRGKALPSVGPASALLLLPVLVPPPGSPRAWRGRAPLPPRAPAGP